LQLQVTELEPRIRERIVLSPSIQLLKSLPRVGSILAIVIEREIGSIDRFDTSGQFTSHAGLVPSVHASGGKTRFGHMRKPCNQYLKWALIEAASIIVRHRHHPAWKTKYVCQIHDQVSQREGHAVAVGAVARPLAESAFWILKRQHPCRPSQAGARARLTCIHRDAWAIVAGTAIDCQAPAGLDHAARRRDKVSRSGRDGCFGPEVPRSVRGWTRSEPIGASVYCPLRMALS
jgi:hypothetical protein